MVVSLGRTARARAPIQSGDVCVPFSFTSQLCARHAKAKQITMYKLIIVLRNVFRVLVLCICGMRYIFVSWCSAMNLDFHWTYVRGLVRKIELS